MTINTHPDRLAYLEAIRQQHINAEAARLIRAGFPADVARRAAERRAGAR